MFHATQDPADAAKRVEANPQTKFENGDSAPFFYHWIGTFAALGVIDPTVKCDWPSSNVYTKDGQKTYVVYNFGEKPLTARFSDGDHRRGQGQGVGVSDEVTMEATAAFGIRHSATAQLGALDGAYKCLTGMPRPALSGRVFLAESGDPRLLEKNTAGRGRPWHPK